LERRILGNSDLAISAIGLGTWAIGGGDWIFGWGPQKDSESLATVRHAIDCGINWIDTAAAYGLGHAEVVLSRALRDVPRRDRPYVFATCSLVWDELGNVSQSLRPHSIRQEAEGSLRRLRIDCFDLYALGCPVSPNRPPADHAGLLETAWETMAALRREGKTRFIGLSNCSVSQLGRLQRIAPVTSVQLPYSLLQREVEDRALPFCERHGIPVIAHSTMHAGLLTGEMTHDRIEGLPHNDWRQRSRFFRRLACDRALGMVEGLRTAGARHGRTAGEVAIAWALSHRAVTAASVGARRPDQLHEVVRAASFLLSGAEIETLNRLDPRSPAHTRSGR
jgi:aryl-alcohol dehydrogenase-like predicted oxidoreductase